MFWRPREAVGGREGLEVEAREYDLRQRRRLLPGQIHYKSRRPIKIIIVRPSHRS